MCVRVCVCCVCVCVCVLWCVVCMHCVVGGGGGRMCEYRRHRGLQLTVYVMCVYVCVCACVFVRVCMLFSVVSFDYLNVAWPNVIAIHMTFRTIIVVDL